MKKVFRAIKKLFQPKACIAFNYVPMGMSHELTKDLMLKGFTK